jgi:hypothetical protein
MKTLQVIAVLTVIVIAAFVLLSPDRDRQSAPGIQGLPWQIETLANGNTRLFGLELTHSTLADARERFGEGMNIGVIAAQGEAGALEAYFDTVTAGVILGKMILVATLDPETLTRLRERSIRRVYMNDATYRYALDPEGLSIALRAPIAAITFIPAANLDAETVLKRFGPPKERLRVSDRVEHFLYPDQGLDLMLDDKGKDVLQYVAPREFARLREPLRQSGMTTPSGDK